MITFRIVGEPAPQGSKARGRHGGLYEMSSKKLKPWRDAIFWTMTASRAAERTIPGPVAAEIEFIMPRPASCKRDLPTVRPDLDKLARAMLDALKTGGAYGDDGQVTKLLVSKRYQHDGEQPGAYVALWEAGA